MWLLLLALGLVSSTADKAERAQYNAAHLTTSMPAHLKSEYLKNGENLADWFMATDAAPKSGALQWNAQAIAAKVASIKTGGDNFLKTMPYEITNVWLQQAFRAHKGEVAGKQGVVVGSQEPNYEALVLSNDVASVSTVEFRNINCPGCANNKMKILTVDQYKAMPAKPQYDFALSVCAINHAGLGRYGDPLDPDGDMKSMTDMMAMLKPGGLLFLAVPIGQDTVVWNAHRIYGKKRIAKLFQGWQQLDTYGVTPADWERPPHGASDGRPVHHHFPSVFVLKKAATSDLEADQIFQALNQDLQALHDVL